MLLQKKIENENYDSFYKNVIEKYFERLYNDEFEILTYFKYYSNYRFDTAKKKSVTTDDK